MTTYKGSCHCGAVTYQVETDLKEVMSCNCSHCHRKGFALNFVDKDKFTLISGEDNLTEYGFNKKAIRHLFCKTCGVQSYADSVAYGKMAINVRCLEDVDLDSLAIKRVNGKDF